MASAQPTVVGIAVDATSVYWTNLVSSGTVMKAPLGGGSPVTLAFGQDYPYDVAVDGTSVYWTNTGSASGDGSVMKTPLGGGTQTTLASGLVGPRGIAVDSTSVYWSDMIGSYADVMKAPIEGNIVGSTPTTIYVSNQSNIFCIAVDATSIYWGSTGPSTVMKAPLGGGEPTTLAALSTTGQSNFFGIAVDATSVYWISEFSRTAGGSSGGAVMRIPLGGGTPITLASGQYEVDCIAIDALDVYWGDGYGNVKKVPLGGGALTTLVSGKGTSTKCLAMKVDATAVYWSNDSDSTVMKVSPK